MGMRIGEGGGGAISLSSHRLLLRVVFKNERVFHLQDLATCHQQQTMEAIMHAQHPRLVNSAPYS